jgi:hypothetical protein
MKHLIKLGTQFIGFRDAAEDLRGKFRFTLSSLFSSATLFCVLTMNSRLRPSLQRPLTKPKKRAESLAVKLEESEKAREKAEQDAAAVGDLRQRLHTAENALSERVSQQIAREKSIINRLETQNRRFVSKYSLLPLSVLITSCLSRY